MGQQLTGGCLCGATSTEIFVAEQPANHAFANETRRMSGAQVFALYAPKQDLTDG